MRSLPGGLSGRVSDPFKPGQSTGRRAHTHLRPVCCCWRLSVQAFVCTVPCDPPPSAPPASQPHLRPGAHVRTPVPPHTCLACTLNPHHLPSQARVTPDSLALPENTSTFQLITPKGSTPTGPPADNLGAQTHTPGLHTRGTGASTGQPVHAEIRRLCGTAHTALDLSSGW